MTLNKLFLLLIFLPNNILSNCCRNDCDDDCGVSPTIVARSQSRYKMRQDVGIVGYSDIFNITSDNNNITYITPKKTAVTAKPVSDKSEQPKILKKTLWGGHFAVIPGFMTTFAPNSIKRILFGNEFVGPQGNCTNNFDSTCDGKPILIQGSKFKDGCRDSRAWLADNFYLAPDYNGQFLVTPHISDFLVDMDLYFDLNSWNWAKGFYARVYAPFVHTHWTLEFCELVGSSTQGYDIGYFDSVEVINSTLLQSFGSYARGDVPCFGTAVTPQGLNFAKITKCKHTKNGIADLRAEIGWAFQTNCYEFGFNIQAAAPTGNRRKAEFLFAPVVGNGHHWELGVGFYGYRNIWRDVKENTELGFYFDANITHLFGATEQRTFDLRNKPSSRYMLAMQMGPPNINLQGNPFPQPVAPTGGELAISQFNGIYTPVANLTTMNINVSVGIQADVVAWFTYSWDRWNVDVGYNFYARSTEHFNCDNDDRCNAQSICSPTQSNSWVLKGDERVFGFAATSSGSIVANQAVPLSASENCAIINQGTNALATPCVVASPDFYQNNCGVDNAEYAVIQRNGSGFVRLEIAPGFNDLQHQVLTSIQPVFISCQDVDFARTRSITNAFFLNLSYTWEHKCWAPFFGLGFFAEFGRNCDQCKSTCFKNCPDQCPGDSSIGFCPTECCAGTDVDVSLSRWGAWLKTGVAFD